TSLSSSSSLFSSPPGLSSSSLSRPHFQELYLTGYGKQFGEKITYSAGVSYAAGLSLGGVYGVCVGLKRGGSTARLRLNSLLNACTQYPPATAAQLATITLFYCCFSNLLGMFREDHPTNATISGALAGGLYKSLASWKVNTAYSVTSALGFTAIDQYLRKYV
ncbi:mitochondrial import inner membrane translocase, partial [Cystoisospora suis]